MFTSRVLPADRDTRLDLVSRLLRFPHSRLKNIVFVLLFVIPICNAFSWPGRVLIAVGYLLETVDINFSYRKSSLLNYAFACSLLATSELAPKWNYDWIPMRRSAEDASQQVDKTPTQRWWAADQAATAEPPGPLLSCPPTKKKKKEVNIRIPPES